MAFFVRDSGSQKYYLRSRGGVSQYSETNARAKRFSSRQECEEFIARELKVNANLTLVTEELVVDANKANGAVLH